MSETPIPGDIVAFKIANYEVHGIVLTTDLADPINGKTIEVVSVGGQAPVQTTRLRPEDVTVIPVRLGRALHRRLRDYFIEHFAEAGPLPGEDPIDMAIRLLDLARTRGVFDKAVEPPTCTGDVPVSPEAVESRFVELYYLDGDRTGLRFEGLPDIHIPDADARGMALGISVGGETMAAAKAIARLREVAGKLGITKPETTSLREVITAVCNALEGGGQVLPLGSEHPEVFVQAFEFGGTAFVQVHNHNTIAHAPHRGYKLALLPERLFSGAPCPPYICGLPARSKDEIVSLIDRARNIAAHEGAAAADPLLYQARTLLDIGDQTPSGTETWTPGKPIRDEHQGLYRKYQVRRTDGRQDAGAEYFVLRLDKGAAPSMAALLAYAAEAELTHPKLAADLRALVGEKRKDWTPKWARRRAAMDELINALEMRGHVSSREADESSDEQHLALAAKVLREVGLTPMYTDRAEAPAGFGEALAMRAKLDPPPLEEPDVGAARKATARIVLGGLRSFPQTEGFKVGERVDLSNHDDTGVRTWRWNLVERPEGSEASIVDPIAAHAWFKPDQPGRYTVELMVNDGHGPRRYRTTLHAEGDMLVAAMQAAQNATSEQYDILTRPDGSRELACASPKRLSALEVDGGELADEVVALRAQVRALADERDAAIKILGAVPADGTSGSVLQDLARGAAKVIDKKRATIDALQDEITGLVDRERMFAEEREAISKAVWDDQRVHRDGLLIDRIREVLSFWANARDTAKHLRNQLNAIVGPGAAHYCDGDADPIVSRVRHEVVNLRAQIKHAPGAERIAALEKDAEFMRAEIQRLRAGVAHVSLNIASPLKGQDPDAIVSAFQRPTTKTMRPSATSKILDLCQERGISGARFEHSPATPSELEGVLWTIQVGEYEVKGKIYKDGRERWQWQATLDGKPYAMSGFGLLSEALDDAERHRADPEAHARALSAKFYEVREAVSALKANAIKPDADGFYSFERASLRRVEVWSEQGKPRTRFWYARIEGGEYVGGDFPWEFKASERLTIDGRAVARIVAEGGVVRLTLEADVGPA